jgi:hypothetical protein
MGVRWHPKWTIARQSYSRKLKPLVEEAQLLPVPAPVYGGRPQWQWLLPAISLPLVVVVGVGLYKTMGGETGVIRYDEKPNEQTASAAKKGGAVAEDELKASAIQWMHDQGKDLPTIKEFQIDRTGAVWKIWLGDGIAGYTIDYDPETRVFVRLTPGE